ncbi:LutC/YkgG family protein [Nitrincola tapanii]|uniref:LUD domain-containing protein n=1 Tax=Nitrincola tapanii TaxID=1708751 RepID=A0A5A9W4I8_9GAMM|nr:LUD domain-containing protein [Nitrincola tapanii]KAA0874988.1 hypothetical protein E1H14_06080 [Nitrincola tapanii]
MSRADIFASIQRGLGRRQASAAERAAVEQRLNAKAPNLIPARGQLSGEALQQLFISMAQEASAEIIELTRIQEVPQAAALWLQEKGIEELVLASDPELQALDWSSTQGVLRREGVAQAGDLASLTLAFAGIAETGTLMLYSHPDSPTSLNFLPDNHLLILRRVDLVGVYEEAWNKLRTQVGENWPRTVNMITGPSRSADIEQKLQMGAHGPRRLVIFLID